MAGENHLVDVLDRMRPPGLSDPRYARGVSSGTRTATCLGAVVATVLLAACGGGDGEGGETEANRLVLTDDECTYEGDDSPPAGELLEIGALNPSSDNGAFELVRIEEGGSFDELEAYIEDERQRLEGGLQPRAPPDFASVVARSEVPSGIQTLLIGTISVGEHALLCARGVPPSALFVIGPLKASDEP